jgi:Holliday junction DNA helicase RuvA
MIAQLRGVIAEKSVDTVVIDCNGVGYGVFVTAEDQGVLATGEPATLYIYENIRENTHDLFGFSNLAVKKLFEQLLGVNGVGPKMALAIFGIGSLDQIKQAIAAGDTKFIARANGVGKRVAERVVVDLKDKLGVAAANDATDFLGDSQFAAGDEAVQALVALGYSAADANLALAKVDKSLPTEDRVKKALQQ